MKRVCEADARPLPKQRVKGHKPYVANKINNTNNARKASNASPNNTNAQASCNALGTMQARPAIQSSCTSSTNKHNGTLHDTQPGPQCMHKAKAIRGTQPGPQHMRKGHATPQKQCKQGKQS